MTPAWARSAAYALLRVTLGVLLLAAGAGKFAEGVGESAAGLAERFEESWLPAGLVSGFGHLLPFVEVGLGVLILAGALTVPALLAAGALFVTFTFGTTLIEDHEATGRNVFYALTTFILLWLARDDRWSLDGWRLRRR